MLLIVGFYKRSVPLFLYGFQSCLYLKDIHFGNMVSCFSGAVGVFSMDYIHYIFIKVLVDNCD